MAKTNPRPEDQRHLPGELAAFTRSTNIDRRQCRRVVPMKVLALGVSRTGTCSLRQALIDLGYKDCYHYSTLLQENPCDVDLWIEAYEAKFLGKGKPFTREDWDQLLGHCQAISDTPCVIFYKELLEAYPDAKVILTVRDSPDQWFQSQMATLIQYARANKDSEGTILARIRRRFSPISDKFYKFVELQIDCSPMFRILFKDNQDGTEHAKQWYLDYIEEIKSVVLEEKLLVMNVKEGWKPLCEFLGEEEPLYPLPKKNDTNTFQRNIDKTAIAMDLMVIWNMTKTIIGPIILGAAAVLVARRYGIPHRSGSFG